MNVKKMIRESQLRLTLMLDPEASLKSNDRPLSTRIADLGNSMSSEDSDSDDIDLSEQEEKG